MSGRKFKLILKAGVLFSIISPLWAGSGESAPATMTYEGWIRALEDPSLQTMDYVEAAFNTEPQVLAQSFDAAGQPLPQLLPLAASTCPRAVRGIAHILSLFGKRDQTCQGRNLTDFVHWPQDGSAFWADASNQLTPLLRTFESEDPEGLEELVGYLSVEQVAQTRSPEGDNVLELAIAKGPSFVKALAGRLDWQLLKTPKVLEYLQIAATEDADDDLSKALVAATSCDCFSREYRRWWWKIDAHLRTTDFWSEGSDRKKKIWQESGGRTTLAETFSSDAIPIGFVRKVVDQSGFANGWMTVAGESTVLLAAQYQAPFARDVLCRTTEEDLLYRGSQANETMLVRLGYQIDFPDTGGFDRSFWNDYFSRIAHGRFPSYWKSETLIYALRIGSIDQALELAKGRIDFGELLLFERIQTGSKGKPPFSWLRPPTDRFAVTPEKERLYREVAEELVGKNAEFRAAVTATAADLLPGTEDT